MIHIKLDINSADAKALCTLPGVGKSLAQAIISDRGARGTFGRAADLRRVPNSKPFERNRLLYVAFSRAAQRLVVYG